MGAYCTKYIYLYVPSARRRTRSRAVPQPRRSKPARSPRGRSPPARAQTDSPDLRASTVAFREGLAAGVRIRKLLDHITEEPIEDDAVSLGCRSDASDSPKARKCSVGSSSSPKARKCSVGSSSSPKARKCRSGSSSSSADANLVNRRVLIRAQKENLTDCVKDQWVCADSSRNRAASDASLDSQV